MDVGTEQEFIETFPDCSNSYAGGLSFMDLFWQDKYAEERRENLYFPFACGEEWEFLSWCVRSGLSMAAINSLLSLTIIKRISLSLPSGPPWLCKQLTSEAPTKQPVRLFYHPPLKCIQSLLSHPLLYPHISFVPRKVWTSAARICRIYKDWLSGECAWEIQEKLPRGATTLGVVLSLDKTNISVISGNPLLPIAKFTCKDMRTRGLLHDRLIHQALHEVLELLKMAAQVGVMMNDPADYRAFLKVAKALHLNGVVELYWVDWPLSCPAEFLHPETLHHFHRFSWDHDIKWCIQVVTAPKIDFRFSLLQPTIRYRGFEDSISNLKQVMGRDHRSIQRYLVGVIAGAVPRQFLIAIRVLVKFCYLVQAPRFSDQSLGKLTDVLKLFHDHKDAVTQAGARKDSWEIPKLELLQSVVPSIQRSGPVMQWSADATEHAHVREIKVPARSGNNRNYYDQIAHHLDRSDKCFRFDVATYFAARHEKSLLSEEDDLDFDQEDDHDELDAPSLHEHMKISISCLSVNYFVIADAIAHGCIPNAPRPHRTFATSTTTFHIADKPSLQTTVDEATVLFGITDLRPALLEFLQRVQDQNVHDVSGIRTQDLHGQLPFDHIQVWYRLHVQRHLYHEDTRVDAPQTLRAFPPSPDCPHGLYDAVVISPGSDSDWPRRGIEGHLVAQLRLVFRPMNADYLLAYVQRFNVVSQRESMSDVHPATGMHLLRRATKSNGTRIGDIVPVSHIRSVAHLVPSFGKEAHPCLSRQNVNELSTDFWLNKFWSKEFYYVLCP
ncbi:hypothetical protein L210DRAFT_3609588 [Boletus edulis BED1]|uniref:DUF6830 domain-containing protein n=1 Tax=Boletus edulis BED1 TaxID=1328754 RepID=A0AAD4C523_BOLED|nr:hypothetical protein L210DRAFT_3609588 [Boletus edulis BED1]